MYASALWLHSLLRWAVLVTGLIAWFRAVGGQTARRPWGPMDDLWSMVFSIAFDLQVLVGLALYVFISPFSRMAFQNFGAAMSDPSLRFWAVEHIGGMMLGIGLVHMGRWKIRKAVEDARRHRLAVIFFGLGLIVTIASIPWPGMRVARPLMRF
jgi:hypothetical protein